MSSTIARSKKPENVSGIIKDENGYYKVKMGTLNSYNQNGVFYKIESLDALLNNPRGALHNRIKDGILKAEVGHPNFDGLYGNDLTYAIFNIDLKNTCAHIKELEFIKTGKFETGWNNYPIYDVFGWVKPIEPYGHLIKDALENPDENVAFSVRSAVAEDRVGTMLVRTILDISTYDFVHENGVKNATQWAAAGVEHKEYVDNGTLCMNGECLLKLEKMLAGTEASNVAYMLAEELKKEKDRRAPKFFDI